MLKQWLSRDDRSLAVIVLHSYFVAFILKRWLLRDDRSLAVIVLTFLFRSVYFKTMAIARR